jgi:hypothetical protein
MALSGTRSTLAIFVQKPRRHDYASVLASASAEASNWDSGVA